MFKSVLLVCAQALLVQNIVAQCLGPYPALAAPYATAPLAAGPCGAPFGYATPARALAASNGPGLAVTSASAVPPVGISVASENAIEGALTVTGAVPFLGTIGLEGVLPTAGAGAVSYGCGNGEVTIVAEDIAEAPLAVGPIGYAAGPIGYAAGPFGYGAPLAYEGAGPCGTFI